jgi:hypothetical protein
MDAVMDVRNFDKMGPKDQYPGKKMKPLLRGEKAIVVTRIRASAHHQSMHKRGYVDYRYQVPGTSSRQCAAPQLKMRKRNKGMLFMSYSRGL